LKNRLNDLSAVECMKLKILSIAVFAMAVLFCGCRDFLPINTIKFTPDERAALRSVKVLRASVMEMDAREPEVKAVTMEQLCRQISLMPTQEFIDLADELLASCLRCPQGAVGTVGGYRYMLVRGKEEGVYAIPEPDFAAARFVFYARIPAGLFLRSKEGFTDRKPVRAPDIKTDAAWRLLPVIK